MKLKEFQKYLKENKISLAFFTHQDPNFTYLAQFTPSHANLIVTPKKAHLFLTKLDQRPRIEGFSVKLLKKGWEKQWEKVKGKVKIGINQNSLTVAQLEKLKKMFPGAKFIDVSPELQKLRARKIPEEIRKIAKACQITSSALGSLRKELAKKTLKTEQDVSLFLERKIRQQGAELAFPTIVALGKNAAIPHHVTSGQKLKKGFLLIDCGARYQNYCSDMTRVFFLGKPTGKEQEFYHLLLKAQEETIKKIKEKIKFSELDKTARKFLGKYSSYFTHSLGHGLGVEIHEAPNSKEETTKIEKNQVFTVEPGIYFPGKFGLRLEDTILFDGEVKVLTKFPKRLVEVRDS